MQSLQVLTVVVAGVSLIVASASLFFACSTRRTIVHDGNRRSEPDRNAPTQPPHGDQAEQRKDLDALRLQHALWIVLAGIGAVFAAFIVVLSQVGDDTTNLGTLFGTVTAAVGTLVGLIAGHHAGSAGRDRAEERARQAMEDRDDKV